VKKILLLGSLTNKKDPAKTGGVTVLFELLLSELRERNIEFDVIDTLKDNYLSSMSAYLSVLLQLMKNLHKYDHISLQATANSFIAIGPIMILLAKFFKKTTSVRKFAGDFHEVYANANSLKKYLIKYVLVNSDVNFFETKYLVEYFQPFNKNTYWFPNVRRSVLKPSLPRKYNKRFVFIGTVNAEKGIDEICEAIKRLDSSYIVDIYGPLYDKKYTKNYFDKIGLTYKGALNAKDVFCVLNNYDVLLLPSYREGYPGIIIEALSLGIPTIATRLKGIMEMVQNDENGILIDIKDYNQLVNAIKSIDNKKYSRYSIAAKESFRLFNSQKQTDLFLERINYKD